MLMKWLNFSSVKEIREYSANKKKFCRKTALWFSKAPTEVLEFRFWIKNWLMYLLQAKMYYRSYSKKVKKLVVRHVFKSLLTPLLNNKIFLKD